MLTKILTALGLGLTLIFMSGCSSANGGAWEPTEGYHGFSGRMSSVTSSNRFRISGMPMDIKVFGVRPLLDAAQEKAAQAKLYALLHGRDIICLSIPGVQSAQSIVAYCQIDNHIELTSYLLQHGFGSIDCEEYARKYGRVDECQGEAMSPQPAAM